MSFTMTLSTDHLAILSPLRHAPSQQSFRSSWSHSSVVS